MMKEEITDEVTGTVEETKSEATVDEKEITPEEKLEQLTQFRKTGSITITATKSQFKNIVNVFTNKIEWKGPGEAQLIMILRMGLQNTLGQFDDTKKDEEQQVQLSNMSIEIMDKFQHRITGKNAHSAEQHMYIFGVINKCAAQLQSIDAEIDKLSGKSDEQDNSDAKA